MDPKLLPDLLVFLEVARSGSISQAARRLHTVQTNVSTRIQKLESALGQRLLTRTSRGIHLTTAGETLLPAARRLLALVGDIAQAFPKSCIRQPVLLRVGSLETFAATHVPKLIAGYRKSGPTTEFAISSGSSRFLMRALQGNELDLAFVSYPAEGENLQTELVLQEELALFAPKTLPGRVDTNSLFRNNRLPLIVQRQACSYSERLLTYLEKEGLPVPRIVEAGSIEALLGLVEQGLGIAIGPRSLLNRRERRIRAMPLAPLGTKRWVSIYLISYQAAGNSALKCFVEHCRQHFAREQIARSPAADYKPLASGRSTETAQ